MRTGPLGDRTRAGTRPPSFAPDVSVPVVRARTAVALRPYRLPMNLVFLGAGVLLLAAVIFFAEEAPVTTTVLETVVLGIAGLALMVAGSLRHARHLDR